MDKKFWLDGACSLDAGIRLQNELTFGQATPRVTVTSIPGRSGDLHMWDGSYSNVTGTAKCYALDANEVAELLPGIDYGTCGDIPKFIIAYSRSGNERFKNSRES